MGMTSGHRRNIMRVPLPLMMIEAEEREDREGRWKAAIEERYGVEYSPQAQDAAGDTAQRTSLTRPSGSNGCDVAVIRPAPQNRVGKRDRRVRIRGGRVGVERREWKQTK